jgi:Sec-independent protein translocase protein TatA
MLSLDPAKLLLVAFVALVVLGPDKIPAAARKLSSLSNDLHRLRSSLHEQVRGSIQGIPLSEELGRARDLVSQGRSLDARSLLERLASETSSEPGHHRHDGDSEPGSESLVVGPDGRPDLDLEWPTSSSTSEERHVPAGGPWT